MAQFERVGSVYRRKESIWPGVIAFVIFLIIIGAAIG